MGINAVWVRGLGNTGGAPRACVSVQVVRPSYQLPGFGPLTHGSLGHQGLGSASSDFLAGVGGCDEPQHREPQKLTHVMWVLGSKEGDPHSPWRGLEPLR